jgi:hypothetical protein
VATSILAVGFVLSLLLAGQAQAARLIVTIEGTRDADSYLYVALFAKPMDSRRRLFSSTHEAEGGTQTADRGVQ